LFSRRLNSKILVEMRLSAGMKCSCVPSPEFGEGLGEEADLVVLQVALLDLAHAVAQHDHARD
jgi:hypothetical protein